MKNVLLVTPTWVNIHEDIVDALIAKGMHVDIIQEYSFPEDSLRVKGKKKRVSKEAEEKLKVQYWTHQLQKIDSVFDFLLVVDGQGINKYLFEELKRRNPNIYSVNYLYDVTYSVYRFESNFHFFDRVLTFDRRDASTFNIELLPIYWSPIVIKSNIPKYAIFGFGSYSRDRFTFFKQIKKIAEKNGYSYYIKNYHKKIPNLFLYYLKNSLRYFLNLPVLISIKDYQSDMITTEFISTERFRQMIYKSEVILDTKVLNQDGLTARFMWALGLGKKIITTNSAVKQYDFYDERQILVLQSDSVNEIIERDVVNFINSKNEIPLYKRKIIDSYRIDNWIDFLFHK